MTEIEKALIEALNEQRLIIQALESRLATIEAEGRYALTEKTPQPLIDFMEGVLNSMNMLEKRQDDLEQVVERRGLGTSWSANRDALMRIVEADEQRMGGL